MSQIRVTDQQQDWAKRCGGGFAIREDAVIAAEFHSYPVLLGPPDPRTGLYFLVHDTEGESDG